MSSKSVAEPGQQTSTERDKQPPGSPEDPVRTFKGHLDRINCIAMFPDGKRIATASDDMTIRIWRINDGKELKRWVVGEIVGAIVLFRNGTLLGSAEGEDTEDDETAPRRQVWVRDVETEKVVAGPLDGHTSSLMSLLDVSPDGGIMASGSSDPIVILWETTAWKRQGDPLECGAPVYCIRFSPSGKLGVGTDKDIQIWDVNRRDCLAQFKGHADFNSAWTSSITWTHDSVYLLSGGSGNDPVIRSWNCSTWKQVGDPWTGHKYDDDIKHIVLSRTGTLLASASNDETVRLWQLPAGKEVARFNHSSLVYHVAFSIDGRFIFSGGNDDMISQWEIPEEVLTACGDDLAVELKNEGSLRGKQKNKSALLDSEIPGQRRNKAVNYERRSRPQATSTLPRTDAECPPPSRFHGVRNMFSRIRPSSAKKGKQKEDQRKRKAPEVVDVPHAPATYGDYVASEEDGRRPYALFFCLLWCQAKENKPDPTLQVYDIDLVNAEQEDILDVPIPTSRVKFTEPEDIELTTMAGQPQAVAGPSHLAESEKHPVAQSS